MGLSFEGDRVGEETAVLDDALVGVNVGRVDGWIVKEGGNNEADDDEADMEGTGWWADLFSSQSHLTHSKWQKVEVVENCRRWSKRPRCPTQNTKLMIHGKIRNYNATDCAVDEL